MLSDWRSYLPFGKITMQSFMITTHLTLMWLCTLKHVFITMSCFRFKYRWIKWLWRWCTYRIFWLVGEMPPVQLLVFYQIWPLATIPLLKDIAVLLITHTHLTLNNTTLLVVVLLVGAMFLEVLLIGTA